MIQHFVDITKGNTSEVDHDSGLGTSRYKSTMSCTASDVRTLWLQFATVNVQLMFIGNNRNAGGL